MMNSFIDALQEKIDELEAEKEDMLKEFDTKIELLRELMEDEGVSKAKRVAKLPASARKSRPGRPKGAKNKKKPAASKHAPKDDLYEEAMKQVAKLEEGGTSAELQKSRTASFNPTARPQPRKPANIHAGTKQEVDGVRLGATSTKMDATVSVDESDLEAN